VTTVAYIGNFTASWCTEVHLAREMESLGYKVERWQEPDNRADKFSFLKRFEEWCLTSRPSVVIFTRTWGLPAEATAMWRRLEQNGIKTCSYHLDLYVGLKREAGILDDPFWRTEYVFTPDGDPNSAVFFADKGINHHWISPAVVSDECIPGRFNDFYDYDVVFVGSEGYHDEWPWRPNLINFLRRRYGNRFRRFGGDMPEGPTRGQNLNDLYATARVVVGDSLHLPGHIEYWTDRYFETVGRGGFMIAPYVPHIDRFLTNGKHIVYYQHPNEGLTEEAALEWIASTVDHYLANPAEARRIARQGQEHVARNHTYRHRLAKAFATMGIRAKPEPVRTIERLELGSGFHPTPGFTHLDINPDAPNVDIVGTAWPLDLPAGSVGEIRAVDVLEHLSYWDTPKILDDWFRVLQPGGRIYIQVPDADTIMRWYVGDSDRLVDRLPAGLPQHPMAGAAWRLLGGHHDGIYVGDDQDFRWNAHYAMFSEFTLRTALQKAGFVDINIATNAHPNLLCNARKP